MVHIFYNIVKHTGYQVIKILFNDVKIFYISYV